MPGASNPYSSQLIADIALRRVTSEGTLEAAPAATGTFYSEVPTGGTSPALVDLKSALVGRPGGYEVVVRSSEKHGYPAGSVEYIAAFGTKPSNYVGSTRMSASGVGYLSIFSVNPVATSDGASMSFQWWADGFTDGLDYTTQTVAFSGVDYADIDSVEMHMAIYAAPVDAAAGYVTAVIAFRALDASGASLGTTEPFERVGELRQFIDQNDATGLVLIDRPLISTPTSNMASLTVRSTAINVWSHVSAEDAIRARMAPNAGGEFEVAYDGGAAVVRLPQVKYGVQTDTLTEIIDQTQLVAADNESAIEAEASRATSAEGTVQFNVDAEEGRARAAEVALGTRITNEAAATSDARGTLTTNLATEVSDRAAAVSAEAALRLTAQTVTRALITTEASTARSAEGANATAIATETARALAAEMAIDDAHQVEVDRAKAAEVANEDAIFLLTQASNSGVAGEKARAEAVEARLQTQISNLLSNTDEVALNSLAEIVADYTTNGADHSAALAAQALKQENERIASDARIAAIEALLEQLQATV